MNYFLGNIDSLLFTINNTNERDFLNNDYPIIERWEYFIATLKLLFALDQNVCIKDNSLIDSGMFRCIYKYRKNQKYKRLYNDFWDLMKIGKDNIIYIYDGRIVKNGKDGRMLIEERFNNTCNSSFIHSAAFKDENNWDGISNAKSLCNTFHEYEEMFKELGNFLDTIDSNCLTDNPQNRSKYDFEEALRDRFLENEKDYREELKKPLSIITKKSGIKITRTDSIIHIKQVADKEIAENIIETVINPTYIDLECEIMHKLYNSKQEVTYWTPYQSINLDQLYFTFKPGEMRELNSNVKRDQYIRIWSTFHKVESLTCKQILDIKNFTKVYIKDNGFIENRKIIRNKLIMECLKNKTENVNKYNIVLENISPIEKHLGFIISPILRNYSTLIITINKEWKIAADEIMEIIEHDAEETFK
jgi:hypothetical protein